MKIALTGSSGLVGTALTEAFLAGGHEVVRLVRAQPAGDPAAVVWNPGAGILDPKTLAGCKAVVHLAGENIAARRWTAAQKARIRDSRVTGTRTLCAALATMDHPPEVIVAASAIGYYGDRGDEVLDEDSDPGSGYLPDVCRAWEAATQAAADCGVRVVNLRIGLVLSARGGALGRMLLPFKLGAGGVLGSGRQYLSWIDLDDLVGIVLFAIDKVTLQGAVNAVAPQAVTNREFTKALGRVLRRPTVLPMPAFAARAAFGEMADALLLASARVVSKRLVEAGFTFQYPQIEAALRHVLGR